MLGKQRDKLVAVKVGKIVKGGYAVLGKLQHHAKADIFEVAKIFGHLQRIQRLVDPLRFLLDEIDGSGLQLLGDRLVETLDGGQLLDRRLGDFLGKDKAFGDEKMRNHIIDVQRLDEACRTGAEFFLTTLRFLGLGQDVDVPAGKL